MLIYINEGNIRQTEEKTVKTFGKIIAAAAGIFVLICAGMSLFELYKATRPEARGTVKE